MPQLHAQLPFATTSLTEADGLVSNYVEDVNWDGQNRMWFATDKGATVFDGYRMKHFTTQNGLGHSYVADMIYWKTCGLMMLLTSAGSLHASDGNILHTIEMPAGCPVQSVWKLPDGHLALLTKLQNGWMKYYILKKDKPFAPPEFAMECRPAAVDAFSLLDAGTAGAADTALLRTLTGRSRLKLIQCKAAEGIGFITDDRYCSLDIVRRNDTVCWTQGNRRFVFKMPYPATAWNYPVPVVYHGRPALMFALYSTGNVLIADTLGNQTIIPEAETGLPVITAMKSGPGGVYISTLGAGVVYFQPGRGSVMLRNKKITRLAKSGTGIWVAANDELVHCTPDGMVWQTGRSIKNITSITEDSNALHVTGLVEYDRFPRQGNALGLPQKKFTTSMGISGYLPADTAFRLTTYNAGILTFNKNESRKNNINVLDNIIEKVNVFPDVTVFTSYSRGALLWYNNGRQRTLSQQNGLISNTVYYVQPDGDSIWVCTQNGLNLVVGNTCTRYDAAAGFTGKRCMYAFEDATGRHFAVSDACLMLVDGNKLRPLQSYPLAASRESGIRTVYFDERDQQLYTGASDGLQVLPIAAVIPDTALLQPVVFSLTSNNGFVNHFEQALTFRSRVNGFLFHVGFSHIDLYAKATLYYRLEGWNERWERVPENFVLSFPQLPAGSYVLHMYAVNADGYAGEPVKMLRFSKERPWYLQWPMVVAYTVLLMLLAWYAARLWARYKVRQKTQELLLDQQLQQERNRISSELHDNVGSQLTNIIAQLDFVESAMTQQRTGLAHQKVESLQQKARQAMNQLRESIWALKEDAIKLPDFCLKVHRYAAEIFDEASGIEFELHNDVLAETELTPWQAVNLLRVLQEGFQNIQKHAGARHVLLHVKTDGQTLLVSLRDDGVGFNQQAPVAAGHGLANMQQRVREMNGWFKISSALQGGTQVEIGLPETGYQVPEGGY